MRIPTNSTFTKEISKKFKQIFHRDMTLGGLQDLQEQLDLIDSVDTHLVNQVSQLKENNNGKSYETARAVRQKYSHREEIVGQVTSSKIQKKSYCVETTPS